MYKSNLLWTGNNPICSIDAEGVDGNICQFVNDGNEDANSSMKLKVFNLKEYLCLYAIKDITDI